MSARARRRAPEQGKEVTAQPRPLAEELPKRVVPEPGLSVDPDDLGTQFLQDATEQGNFESEAAEASELSIVEGPPTDDSLVGPNFDPAHDIWEQTVDLAVQHGGTDAAQAEASPAAPDLESDDAAAPRKP